MKASDLLKAADTHANRPAANAVPTGGLYSCTTHNLIYRSDGSSWATWATLGGSSGITVQDENSNVATGVTQIDFQGAGVSAASGSGEVVVTISGGGSGAETWEDAMTALSSGLVHRWKFDETSGTNVDDAVGSLDLTLSGTHTRNVATGLSNLGVCTTFGAGSKAISSGLGSIPVTSAARTIVAIARTNGHSTSEQILASYGASGSRTSFGLILNNGGTSADDGGFNGATAYQVPDSLAADGNWQMVAASYGSQALTSFVSGKSKSAHDTSAENTTATGNFVVGQFLASGTLQLLADVADIAVWDRKLAPQDLFRLFRALQ